MKTYDVEIEIELTQRITAASAAQAEEKAYAWIDVNVPLSGDYHFCATAQDPDF